MENTVIIEEKTNKLFTMVKKINDEAATAPTVTASKPETESRENLAEGPIQYHAAPTDIQARSQIETEGKESVTSETDPPMTEEESVQRDRLVEIVSKGLEGASVANQALREIRDRRLYRATHKNFAEFCRDVMDISEGRASQLITHAIQCEELKQHFSDLQIPTSERAVRELRRAPAAVRIKVLEKALEFSGGVRPKMAQIMEARVAVEGPKKPATEKPEVITPQDAVTAAETLKAFLEKCVRKELTIGEAEKIGELTKGIADIAATRLQAA